MTVDSSKIWKTGRAQFFTKILFFHKKWQNGPKTGKIKGFQVFPQNFVVSFFSILCWMKVQMICFVLAQMAYLGKFWFSSCEIPGFLNLLYLKKRMMNQLDFWYADKDSVNVKYGLKF